MLRTQRALWAEADSTPGVNLVRYHGVLAPNAEDRDSYLDLPYYVGLLSASAIHGSGHQQPMVYQVVTSKPTREMRSGKVAIRFSMSGLVESLPVVEQQTETGTMRVAAPESCAFDLVRYPEAAGHLSKVATVLAALAEPLDAHKLVDVAPLVRLPDVQRLGQRAGMDHWKDELIAKLPGEPWKV